MAPSGTRLALLAVLLWAWALSPVVGKRKEPPAPLPAVVQALKPTGLRISILDEEGMDLVIVNANVNKPIEAKETGKIEKTILRAQDGFWTMEDTSQEMKPNDIVFYWIYYSKKEGRRNYVGHQVISELVDPSCKPSITTVNGQPACRGALVFEDNFDTFNKTAWKHRIEFSEDQFNVFVPDEENSFTEEGILHLKPTAVTDEAQLSEPLKLEGCTSKRGGDWCERKPFAWQILPPSRSPWLTSTSSFRFGRFEMRAKPAAGDWLFSKMYLYPLEDEEYGLGTLASGEILAMQVRGNADLVNKEGHYYGAKQNRVHTGVGSCWLIFFDYWEKNLDELYSDKFHTFAINWTPREINFELDREVFKRIVPPQPDGFAGTDQYKDCETFWEKGTFMSPFDKEFTINFNLNVGGFHAFWDDSKSRNQKKPWKNSTPRAALEFWRDRDSWLPTWKGDFEIDYVKVWAL